MTQRDCRKAVLVVEDDPEVAEAIAEVLEENDYRPLRAANGAEALDRLRTASQKPCLILLDMMMPKMDGWQFRAAQQDDPALSDIPVVLLSAHADVVSAAQRMQASGFLPKPVPLQTLLDTVERFCISDAG